MPAVNGKAIKERAARLRALGAEQVQKHLLAQQGLVHKVLMENPRMGRTEQFTEVLFDTDQPEGQIVTGLIHGITGEQLLAKAQ